MGILLLSSIPLKGHSNFFLRSWFLPWLNSSAVFSTVDLCFLHFPDTAFFPFFLLSLLPLSGSFMGLTFLCPSLSVSGVLQDCILGLLPSDLGTVPGWIHACPRLQFTVTLPLIPVDYGLFLLHFDFLNPKLPIHFEAPVLLCLLYFSNGFSHPVASFQQPGCHVLLSLAFSIHSPC